MASRHLLAVFIFFSGLFLFAQNSFSQTKNEEKHIEVSLRMMGHRILLSVGDSVSRVLPIEKEQNQYKIKFDADFEFDAGLMVSVIDSVVKETKLADQYIVDFVECENKQTFYSFEFNEVDSLNVLPCRTRGQEKACYVVLFTILDEFSSNEIVNKASETDSSLVLLFAFIAVTFLILLLYFLRKKRKINPNLVSIGKYQFDTRNMELVFDKKTIELTSKEADLLFLLHDSINVTVERDDILKSVWGDEGDYIGRTLDVYISKLRKKLEEDLEVKIVNIRGVGYKLVV